MRLTNAIKHVTLLVFLLVLIGCSSSDTAISPSETENSDTTVSGETAPDESVPDLSVLGNHYQIVIDQDLGTCELVDRNAEFNVTSSFDIRLLSYQIDPVKNLLYVKIELENIVYGIFWGVRLVFSETGGLWLTNTDGYDFYKIAPPEPPSKRMPFIAYNRDTYHRKFAGGTRDTRELVFYLPPDMEIINFWLDAVQPWEREKPVVEEQFCHKTMAISAWAITAFCYDFQSHNNPSPWGGLNDIEVWADLSSVGGPSKAEMFDDGGHFDFAEGDYIYGIDFVPDPIVDFAIIPIYCKDSDENISENQVAFIRHYTLRDFPIDTIERGIWSELMGPHYEIIRDDVRWEEFWIEHKDAPIPPPYVDFSKDIVLVAIAGRGSGSEEIDIKRAFINTKNKLELQVSIWNGSKGCLIPTILTNSYHIAKIDKNSFYPDPKIREKLFYCDGQIPFNIVESGDFSEIHERREVRIENWDDWETLWNEHSGGSTPPPYIDFDADTVVAVFLGDRELDDTYVDFDRIMEYQMPSREIYWSEHYPGYGCELAPLDCQPYSIIVFSKAEYFSYEFFHRLVPDDCV